MRPEELSYKVKQVVFKGRSTPVLLQDVNGPCPILGALLKTYLHDARRLVS